MEKTFEELIREYPTTALLSGRKVITDLESLYDLMQQVREATKKEDAEIANKYKSPHIAEAILNTTTDRIKLTDKSTVCSNQKRYIESLKDEDGYFRK